MNPLLVSVDSLRYDHLRRMENTRNYLDATHERGELLGEDNLGSHPGKMRPELLQAPVGPRNASQFGDVVSLINIPTILRGVTHGQGTLDREAHPQRMAKLKAAMNKKHIATDEGMFDLESRESASNPSIERQFKRFEAGAVVKEDAVLENQDELGFA